MPFVSVYYEFKNNKYGVATDFDGNFILKIDKDFITSHTIDLIVSYVGYDKFILKDIDINNYSNALIELENNSKMIHCTFGMIVMDPPLINFNPSTNGTTTFKRDEIKHSIYQ